MRIAKIEDLHCNAGWRDFSFLKVTSDEGLVGWSEFMESVWLRGPERGDPQARRPDRRLGPAGGGEDHRVSARRDAAVGRRHRAAGDRRDRERAGRSEGEGAWGAGLRDAWRAGARSAAALLVALRDVADQSCVAHQGMDRVRSDPIARGCGARGRGSGAARLQGIEDQHHAVRCRRSRISICPGSMARGGRS